MRLYIIRYTLKGSIISRVAAVVATDAKSAMASLRKNLSNQKFKTITVAPFEGLFLPEVSAGA